MSAAFRIEDHPILFLRPRLSVPYSWAGHIPFAYLAVDLLRPKRIVELGTHSGNSYLAFCQAVAELGLDTRCVAIDSWEGDEHAQFYGEPVYRELQAYHDPRYGSFSRLYRGYFDDAVASFADGEIDLLHIDGLHTYEAVRHDFETWLPKLSPRAVVLFHDTAVLKPGFGVGRYFEELSTRYAGFAFEHSNGLGVLVVGKEAPRPFVQFLESFRADPAKFQRFFEALSPVSDSQALPAADLAPASVECQLYYRSTAEGYSEERRLNQSHGVAAGVSQLYFKLPPDFQPDFIRVDPADIPGVFGFVRLALLAADGSVLYDVGDVSERVTVVNGDRLPAQYPSWVRWVELGNDPFVELRVDDLFAMAAGKVASIQITLDYEVVLSGVEALRSVSSLHELKRSARERALDLGQVLAAFQDGFGRLQHAINCSAQHGIDLQAQIAALRSEHAAVRDWVAHRNARWWRRL